MVFITNTRLLLREVVQQLSSYLNKSLTQASDSIYIATRTEYLHPLVNVCAFSVYEKRYLVKVSLAYWLIHLKL